MKYYLIFTFILISSVIRASHIVGGEFELSHVDGNTYELKLITYFDFKNGSTWAFNQEVHARIFRKKDNLLMNTVSLPAGSWEFINYHTEGCEVEEVETIRYIRSKNIILNPLDYNDPDGYYVAWESCCRNYVIDNIHSEDPNNGGTNIAGQTFYLEFPAVVDEGGEPFINSSPSLFRPLSDYACIAKPYWADFSATDPDGDSLSYSLVTPLSSFVYDRGTLGSEEATQSAPYPYVTWKGIYSLNGIMAGDPDLSITKNGLLTVTPVFEGLYLFSVQCDEYRDGVRIGRTIRDYQLFVIDVCPVASPPVIGGKKVTDATFEYGETMSVVFSSNESDSERCLEIQVSDSDSEIPEDYSESIILDVLGLNFDSDTIDVILPDIQDAILISGSTESFEICFPECPFVNPQKSPFYEIGIVVYDDYCPVPLTDTLKVQVEVKLPVNNKPILKVDGEIIDYYINVTEGNNLSISVPIVASDSDDDDLNLYIIPVGGFSPELAGMSFSEPQYSKGQVTSVFNWNFDCNSDLNFSEGVDMSTEEVAKRLYQLLVVVEDTDKCKFNKVDTITMNLMIDFPEEYPPNIFLVGRSEVEDYYRMEYYLYDKIDLRFKALDGGNDTDRLDIIAIGEDFDLNDYNASFNEVIKGIGVEPGSRAEFIWDLKCEYFSLSNKNVFRVNFIVEDHDLCNLTSKDTLTVDFVIDEDENLAPKLHLENLEGEIISDNILNFEFPNDISFNIIAEDLNLDSLYLSIDQSSTNLIGSYELLNTNGFQNVKAYFNKDFDCKLLWENSVDSEYIISIRVDDNHCTNQAYDVIEAHVRLKDHKNRSQQFMPPNVFTPNGDGINDYFGMYEYNDITNRYFNILPESNCGDGEFKKISIVDRWGKKVFVSSNREFKWEGERVSGVYYYVIEYTHKNYNGVITVIK